MAPNRQVPYHLPVEPIRMPEDFLEQSPGGSVVATEAVMNTVRTAEILLDRIGKVLRPLGVSSAGGLVLGILREIGRASCRERV